MLRFQGFRVYCGGWRLRFRVYEAAKSVGPLLLRGFFPTRRAPDNNVPSFWEFEGL